jgi:hypothetical protein
MPALNLTTTEAETALETDLALPGIKRGIAIGVACSVSVVVIAILAFFAIRRRNRVLARRARLQTTTTEPVNDEAGPQEKAWWAATPASSPSLPPPPPPVEADVRTIYELDAGQIPELHGDTAAHEVEGNSNHAVSEEAEDLYAQKLQQWRSWNIAPEPNAASNTVEPVHSCLPLLMVSPPEGSPGEISPLLRSSWDYPSQDASPVSPPPNVHFPSSHHGHTNN